MMPFADLVLYKRTGTPGWKIRDWDTANKLLGYLDPKERPSACFTRRDGSYVQCAGSKTCLTVEARLVNADASFTHIVFGKGYFLGRAAHVHCSIVGPITVDASQVLTMRDARIIIRQFLEQGSLPEKYQQQDVTERFPNQAPHRTVDPLGLTSGEG